MRQEKVSKGMFEILYVAQVLVKDLGYFPSRKEIATKVGKSPSVVSGYILRLLDRELLYPMPRGRGVRLSIDGEQYLKTRIEDEKQRKV